MFPYSEPTLVTDPALVGVLGELQAREPIFHHPEFATTRADFDNLMAPDFWEVGASGRRYSRESILDELERRYAGEYVEGPLVATELSLKRRSCRTKGHADYGAFLRYAPGSRYSRKIL